MRQLLLVEDDFIVAMDTSGALREAGYGVVHAQDAASAMDAVSSTRFAALITDVNLGAGVNGFAIAHQWRALHPGKPVIFLTGEGPVACSAAGVAQSEWMGKPFDCVRLLKMLAQVLDPTPLH